MTTSSRTSGCAIICCAVSIDGFDRQVTTSGGPPAPVMALFRSATVSIEHRFASGCTQNTTLLPAASMPMALQMIVDVGLVDGVMAPITPNGAGSMSDRPWSPVTALGNRSSRPGVFSVTRRFFTTLSSYRPSPVSSRADFASASAFAVIAARMAARMAARRFRGRAANIGCAAFAARAASSTDA